MNKPDKPNPTPRVVTASSGQMLRDYASRRRGQPRVAVFPESGLSPGEQAAFMNEYADQYDEIVTFSPFIISDARPNALRVLDQPFHDLCRGDSVNRIVMRLGQGHTIGGGVRAQLDRAIAAFSDATTAEAIDEVIRGLNHLGDSVEEITTVKLAMDKRDRLSRAQSAGT